jgi:hypothetical protein
MALYVDNGYRKGNEIEMFPELTKCEEVVQRHVTDKSFHSCDWGAT